MFAGRYTMASVLIVGLASVAAARETAIPTELRDYIAKADDSFAWQVISRKETDSGKAYELDLISQKWQGITWKHALAVYEPAKLRHPRHVLLFVSGGSNQDRNRPQDVAMGMKLAEYTAARVAVINQVPNQPLFDGRKEDDLITETWLRYLKDGDPNWPLLFPMVKSAVRAMDTVQALAKQEWNGTVDGFVISGGSKRGWTSWLAAAADKRLIGTAPLVIDVLNFRAHTNQQLATWGAYSEQIADYTTKGLIKPGEESPREQHLREMMDPFTYLSEIKIPKLLIHGTNDPYWCIDATKFYWDDMVGPKYLLKLPNDGHGLENNRDLALRTIGVFFQATVQNKSLPRVRFKGQRNGKNLKVEADCETRPAGAMLWSAASTTKDFRPSKWESQPLQFRDDRWHGERENVFGSGHFAYFVELNFHANDLPYSLTSQIHWE